MDRSDVAKALAGQGVGTYDQVRETLKEVEVDATCVVGPGGAWPTLIVLYDPAAMLTR